MNKMILHDPVCGMDLPANRVFLTETIEDVTYAFCSSQCAKEFMENETKYRNATRSAAAPFEGGSHEHMTRDAICGRTVDERAALSVEGDGERFYFCGENCKQAFEKL